MQKTFVGDQGFTLIEVLVAVFVLAFGVIAVAAMQLTALRLSQQTKYQSIAVQLSAEMADIMRANPAQASAQHTPFLLQVDAHSVSSAAKPPSCFSKAACSAAQLAAFEIAAWSQRVVHELPEGRATVCRDSTPWKTGTRSFTWECDHQASANMVIKIGWLAKDNKPTDASAQRHPAPPYMAMTVVPTHFAPSP